MDSETTSTETTAPTPSLLQNLSFGLKVWIGEMKLMLVGMGRRFEIRQLEKRLEQEQATLGRFTAAHLSSMGEEPTAPSFDMIRAVRQVLFLQEEICRLRKEQETASDREQTSKRQNYCA